VIIGTFTGAAMTLHLTDAQRQAIEEHGGTPIPFVDASTNARYVLLRADQFEKVRSLFEEEDFDPREVYPFIDKVMQEDDALDPTLESYQDSPGRPP
jgi:hypothetical protein